MNLVLLQLLCWSIVGHTTATDLSEKMQHFLTYITGYSDNRAHIALKGTDYDLVEVRVLLARVPALDPYVTLFVEQATRGVLKFFHLGVVTEGPANTVTMKLYNFTDFSNITFGSYDLDKISEVKREHLQSDEECVASFEIIDKGLMTGIYPNCRYTDHGKHPYLSITYNCNYETVVFPNNTDQKHMVAPYVFQHKRVALPVGYMGPCDSPS